jgi:ABC-type multidrug transport system ATPase subunit
VELIAARSVGKRYGQKEVLTGVDLDVQRGEVLAVIGPTGAGKTTLLRILDLLEKPTSGKVYFDGQDTHGLPEAARVQH